MGGGWRVLGGGWMVEVVVEVVVVVVGGWRRWLVAGRWLLAATHHRAKVCNCHKF